MEESVDDLGPPNECIEFARTSENSEEGCKTLLKIFCVVEQSECLLGCFVDLG